MAKKHSKTTKKSDGMGGETFYPEGKNFVGPEKSIHSPSNLFDTLPVPGGEDAALESIHKQDKLGIKGR